MISRLPLAGGLFCDKPKPARGNGEESPYVKMSA
jgi:hypothetical protein